MIYFVLCSIFSEWIDGICSNFAYALTLTRSRLGLFNLNFCKFTTELWPLLLSEFHFFSISCERIDRIWSNFAYVVSLSMLGLLHVNFCKFTTVMALDDHQNFFALTLTRSRFGLLHINFSKFTTKLLSDFCFCSIFCEWIEKNLVEFCIFLDLNQI